jgi:hypothetical protein
MPPWLPGRQLAAVHAGACHPLARGANSRGQLGNDSATNSWRPISVSSASLGDGARMIDGAPGFHHSLFPVAAPQPAAYCRLASPASPPGPTP